MSKFDERFEQQPKKYSITEKWFYRTHLFPLVLSRGRNLWWNSLDGSCRRCFPLLILLIFVCSFDQQIAKDRFNVSKGIRTKLQISRRLSSDKFSVGIRNNKTGTPKLSVANRHVVTRGNPSIDDGREFIIVLDGVVRFRRILVIVFPKAKCSVKV